jgi:hypothetical protein
MSRDEELEAKSKLSTRLISQTTREDVRSDFSSDCAGKLPGPWHLIGSYGLSAASPRDLQNNDKSETYWRQTRDCRLLACESELKR